MKNHFLLVFPATKKHSCGVIFKGPLPLVKDADTGFAVRTVSQAGSGVKGAGNVSIQACMLLYWPSLLSFKPSYTSPGGFCV